jgi:pimeloyl-ACP methyl ester carboxylesterase
VPRKQPTLLPVALVDTIRHTLEGRVLSAYIMTAYSENYADVSFDHYVRPAARVQVREAAKRCLDLPDAIPSVLTALLSRQPIYAVDPLAGALGRRLAENTPREPIKAPLLIAQGDADPLVLPSVQRAYVNQRCHAGQRVEYVTYRNRDHLSLLWSNSPLVSFLLAWSEARFAERPVENRCTVASR